MTVQLWRREPSLDPLCAALRYFVHRDRADEAVHLGEDPGWTPITTHLAMRLRELNEHHSLWAEEPDLVRQVLDGPWE